MKTLEEHFAQMPVERRKRIEKRAAELIAEEITRRELRKAYKRTRTQMAKALGVERKHMSSVEEQSDLYIAAFRRSIEALGGELTLVAKFPKGAPVEIMGLGDLHP